MEDDFGGFIQKNQLATTLIPKLNQKQQEQVTSSVNAKWSKNLLLKQRS